MEQYAIMLGDRTVGTTQVSREGLYYRFRCRCELPGGGIYRILVRCGGREEHLGIPVPIETGFGLDTRIPVKRLGEGKLSFSLAPKHRPVEGKFIPLSPEEPFRYITRLREAYLERRNGQIGIVIKEPDRA